jgi:hypothetical protein
MICSFPGLSLANSQQNQIIVHIKNRKENVENVEKETRYPQLTRQKSMNFVGSS